MSNIVCKAPTRKSQLHFTVRPMFNLIYLIHAVIFVIWMNYPDARLPSFPPTISIFAGLFSFLIGMLIGVAKRKGYIKALVEATDGKMEGWDVLASCTNIWKTPSGKKVFYYFVAIFSIPTLISILILIVVPFSRYKVLLGPCYGAYFLGIVSGLHFLSVYLWSRKLPD